MGVQSDPPKFAIITFGLNGLEVQKYAGSVATPFSPIFLVWPNPIFLLIFLYLALGRNFVNRRPGKKGEIGRNCCLQKWCVRCAREWGAYVAQHTRPHRGGGGTSF